MTGPGPRLAVLCDFDGTITLQDVGEALCRRFAPGALERVDAEWHAGRVSFGEAFRLACLEIRATEDALVAHALEVGALRPGFPDLVAACRDAGAELVVASAGLDLYVRPILRRALGDAFGDLELHVARACVTPRGLEVDFVHRHPSCHDCGTCKGRRARLAREAGRRVVAVGDSYSDRCLVAEADVVFARDWLARHCAGNGLPHRAFDDFGPVAEHVRTGR